MSTLTIRAMTDDDLPQVLDLLSASLAGGPTGRRTEDFFRWKHLDNPFGRSMALLAESDGAVVGVRLFMRWELVAGGRTLRAVRAVDTATHPDHQGRGIFRTLTLQALEELRADTDLVFNTPNSQSLPGYLKMGWSVVEQVPVLLRPSKPLHVLRGFRDARAALPTAREVPAAACRLAGAAQVLAEPGVGELLEVLREQGAADPALRTDRTPTYLDWRYGRDVGLDYRGAVVRDADGAVRALGLGRLRLRGSLLELTVTEVLAAEHDGRWRRRLLRELGASGVDHSCLVAPTADVLSDARRTGHLPVPGQRMTLVTNPLRPSEPDPLLPGSWAVALGDLELF